MASPELAGLIEGLRANGPDLTAPPPQVRAAFEEMLAAVPFSDDLSCDAIDLGGIPGLRMASPDAEPATALLYLHGGAYVIGSAQAYRSLAAELARAAGAVAYSIDYRLAPEHPMPAAIEDAAAAYRALLAEGFDASRIVIAGDSAGGGLTLATLLALRDAGDPLPAAALFLANADPRDPRASPAFADLAGLPPLLIQVGTAEILLDDAIAVARAAGLAGVEARLAIWADMIHVWHAFAFMLPEGRAAIEEAGQFLRRHLG
jgi:monoterpene epsilon-lactone hydrolase